MIKTISFDFWNTLVNGNDENGSARRNVRLDLLFDLFKRYDNKLERDQLPDAYSHAWGYFVYIWMYDQRTLSTQEMLMYMLSYFGFQNVAFDLIDELAEKTARTIVDYPPTLSEEYLPELLQELSEKYRLCIISDTAYSDGNALREVLKVRGILKYFTDFAFSDEVGRSKPHESMFSRIIDGSPPSELLHIGDLVQTDVTGALNFGAAAVQYTRLLQKDSHNLIIEGDKTSACADGVGDELPEMAAEGSCHVIDSWRELPGVLERINKEKSE
jgi:FMN phosphatase YigB (HAD superfamily)